MPADQHTDILDSSKSTLAEWFRSRNQPAYRVDQVLRWIYRHRVDAFSEMTNLPGDLRSLLAEHFRIGRPEIVREAVSVDGTRKFLWRLADGAFIESVLIPETGHFTLCISSQVGCAQGCRFCQTARGGFVRNLSPGEIIAQVRETMKRFGDGQLTNIVVMGMGEPLANYENMRDAIAVITDADTGLAISHRRFTLSTAGFVSRLADLGRDTRINLAVSLNAADNVTRSRLMPINRRWPIEALIDACRRYPLAPRQRITFEYILMAGVNDRPEDARRLSRLLGPLRAKINLIPFNEHPESPFRRPDAAAIRAFQEILVAKHYTSVVRYSKGQDISAACGQLRANALTTIPD